MIDTLLIVCFHASKSLRLFYIFLFQADDGIRGRNVTGVQTCALPIFPSVLHTAHRVCSSCFACQGFSSISAVFSLVVTIQTGTPVSCSVLVIRSISSGIFWSCSLVIGPCIPWISGMTLSAIVSTLRAIPERFIASLVAVASQVPTRRCFLVTVVYSASWPSWSQLVSPGSGPLFPATRMGLVRVTPIGWKSHSQGLSPAIARKSIGRALLLVDCG